MQGRTIALAAAFALTGCAVDGSIQTRVTRPGIAERGKVAYSRGQTSIHGRYVSGLGDVGNVVALSSSASGPNARDEGDTLWRVEGPVLEFCRRANDGHEDCRDAVYEQTAQAYQTYLGTFPTILDVGRTEATRTRAPNAFPELVTDAKAKGDPVLAEHPAWVVLGQSIGARFVEKNANPLFLCSVADGVPTCHGTGLGVSELVGGGIVRDGATFTSVVWIQAIERQGILVSDVEKKIVRCAAIAGKPDCRIAKEISR